MNKRKNKPIVTVGIAASVIAVLLLVGESSGGYLLSDAVASARCGAKYLALNSGVLADQACGFNANMQLAWLCIALLGSGISTTVYGWHCDRRTG